MGRPPKPEGKPCRIAGCPNEGVVRFHSKRGTTRARWVARAICSMHDKRKQRTGSYLLVKCSCCGHPVVGNGVGQRCDECFEKRCKVCVTCGQEFITDRSHTLKNCRECIETGRYRLSKTVEEAK